MLLSLRIRPIRLDEALLLLPIALSGQEHLLRSQLVLFR